MGTVYLDLLCNDKDLNLLKEETKQLKSKKNNELHLYANGGLIHISYMISSLINNYFKTVYFYGCFSAGVIIFLQFNGTKFFNKKGHINIHSLEREVEGLKTSEDLKKYQKSLDQDKNEIIKTWMENYKGPNKKKFNEFLVKSYKNSVDSFLTAKDLIHHGYLKEKNLF